MIPEGRPEYNTIEDSVFEAKGKCLLAGGYSILFEGNKGIVKSSHHYFQAVAKPVPRSSEESAKITKSDILVEVLTPQFPRNNQYLSGWSILETRQIFQTGNKFIDSSIDVALKVVSIFSDNFKDISKYADQKILIILRQTEGFIRSEFVQEGHGLHTVYTHQLSIEKLSLCI